MKKLNIYFTLFSVFSKQITSTKEAKILPSDIYGVLLYRHERFAGKYTTRKIHNNYIRDPSGLFSIISHVSLSMT